MSSWDEIECESVSRNGEQPRAGDVLKPEDLKGKYRQQYDSIIGHFTRKGVERSKREERAMYLVRKNIDHDAAKAAAEKKQLKLFGE